jgi:tetratricopeptide (TPR) repeat protein
MEEFDNVLNSYNKALEITDKLQARKEKVNILTKLAEIHEILNDFPDAIKAYNEMLEILDQLKLEIKSMFAQEEFDRKINDCKEMIEKLELRMIKP